jgi:nucleoside-triphosphatase THEP1
LSTVIIIHGSIGGGKTEECLEIMRRARSVGIRIFGVLSPRVFSEGETIGYDLLDPETGETFPLAHLRELVDGPDWRLHGNLIYAFSQPTLKRANRLLSASAEAMGSNALLFVDEYGRLEKAHLGLYSGSKDVSMHLDRGGVVVFSCRTDVVSAVEKLVQERVGLMHTVESDDLEAIWGLILESIKLEL